MSDFLQVGPSLRPSVHRAHPAILLMFLIFHDNSGAVLSCPWVSEFVEEGCAVDAEAVTHYSIPNPRLRTLFRTRIAALWAARQSRNAAEPSGENRGLRKVSFLVQVIGREAANR